MNSIISATTGATYGSVPTVPASGKRDTFLGNAHALLEETVARLEQGKADLALEAAYRAALRTAGAVIEGSAVIAKRKRLPSSAWEKLKLTGVRGRHWAEIFESYSALRGRVASGIELYPDPAEVEALVGKAVEFFDEVSLEVAGGEAAAA